MNRLLAAALALLCCLAPSRAQGVTIDSKGWTIVTPSSARMLVHVDPAGSDSAPGTAAAPKKTIAAGMAAMRDGYPDWLLLKAGATFPKGFGQVKKSGRSKAEPMVFGVYGGSARAKIRCGSNEVVFQQNGDLVEWLVVVDIDLEPLGRSGGESGSKGIEILGPARGILFEDVRVAGFHTNVIVMNAFGGAVSDIKLRRCQVLNAWGNAASGHSNGMYVQKVVGFEVYETLLHHNGFDSPTANTGANPMRHNVYGQNGPASEALAFESCVISRGSATGLMLRAGGSAKGCLFVDNPIALIIGGGNTPHPAGVPAVARGNVILYGSDISTKPEDKRGWGFGMSNINGGRVTDNLIAHNKGGFGIAAQIDGNIAFGVANLVLERNVVVDWPGGLQKQDSGGRIRGLVDTGNDWNRPASTCVDPNRSIPANLIPDLCLMDRWSWDPKKMPASVNRSLVPGYARK